MKRELTLRRGKLYRLSFIFIIAEVVFAFQVIEEGNGDLRGSFLKTIAFLIVIFFLFKGFNWARWILVVALLLLSIGCFLSWLENGGVAFVFITLCYLYFAVELVRSKAVAKNEADGGVIIPDPTVIDVIDMSESFVSQKPPIKDGFYVGEEIYKYPLLIKRYQSLLIDWFLLFSIMVVTMVVLGESEWRKIVMISLAGIFLLGYEPILTTYSATIGQRMMGIRVRDMKDPKKRINIFQAYIRIVVKWLLGWLSFVTINFNAEHRAIHDIAGASVVIKIK